MKEISEGWVSLPLQDCVYFQEGPGLRKWQFGESGIPFLNIRTFNNGTIDKTKCQFVKTEEFTGKYEHFLLEEGDIVVSSSGTLGKLVVVREQDLPLMLNTSVIRYRSFYPQHLLQSFLKFFLQSHHFFKQIDSSKTGSAILNYGPSHLKEMRIIVPPLNEQRRIVAKLEKLLSRVDAANARLATIPRILKRFRQSVLAAACSGRLTADWREENPRETIASSFLESINLDNELPNTWATTCVGDVINGLKYGTSQKCSYEKRGVPVLRIPNISDGYIETTDIKYAELPPNEFEQLKLSAGDILLIRSNGSVSLVGKSALVRNSEDGFAYAGYLIRLKPNRSHITPEFLNLSLSSHGVRLQIEVPARSTSGVNNINSDEVRALEIALPPLPEQQEIVRRVESLFKTADALEARYRTAKAHVDKLTQSILARAFRGQLVTTEAELARQEGRDYEPASVLLERIRHERTQQQTNSEENSKRTGKLRKRQDTATKAMFS